jgi:hypothetical protein
LARDREVVREFAGDEGVSAVRRPRRFNALPTFGVFQNVNVEAAVAGGVENALSNGQDSGTWESVLFIEVNWRDFRSQILFSIRKRILFTPPMFYGEFTCSR